MSTQPQICPDHGQPFKWVPPGFSKKTGEPYEGFWSCQTRGCRRKPNQNAGAQPAGKAAGAAPVARPAAPAFSIDEAARQRGIAMAVAVKAGVDFVGHFVGQSAEPMTAAARLDVAIQAACRLYNDLLIPALHNSVPLTNGGANAWDERNPPPATDDDIPC